MRFLPWTAVALLLLAGCTEPAARFTTAQTEPGPPGDGGPYGGDGTVRLVAVYFSFDIEEGKRTHGNMGGHCAFDDWTLDPPSAHLDVPSDRSVPDGVVMREIHPDEDDLDRVGHFGTAPMAHFAGHWDDLTLDAAFDHERRLGTVSFRDGRAWFDEQAIPTTHWLLAHFRYEVEDQDETVRIDETLHLRDLGEAPASFDRSDPLCM